MTTAAVDPAPIIKQSASEASSTPAPVVESAAAARGKGRQVQQWLSGWCSGGETCQDGRWTGPDGQPLRRCLFVGHNGEKVTPREVYCRCECHRDDPRSPLFVQD